MPVYVIINGHFDFMFFSAETVVIKKKYNGNDMNNQTEPNRYCVYLLRCADGTLYCGYTTNPEKRAQVHNSGLGAKYTRIRCPVTLSYVEYYETKSEAMKREAAIKKLTRAQKDALIAQYDSDTTKNTGDPHGK